MLDMKWVRESAENQEQLQRVADQKGIALSVAELVELDEQRRALLLAVEGLRQKRNTMSLDISNHMKQGQREEAELLKQQVKAINTELDIQEGLHREVDAAYNELLILVPNIVSPDTPVGASDQDNVEVKRVGQPPEFEFEYRDHVTLGELHRLIDIPRGVKTAGTRSYYLTGIGAMLHRAVQQLAVDMLTARGFTLMDVPLTVRTEAMQNTAFFPLGQDQAFHIAEEDKWLVGTSEVPLVSFYSGEIVDVTQPIRLAAASLCFRSEVGSGGRDVHGLYRVHQFAKVEQVVLCEASEETSEQLLQEITANAEELLQMLELPYRVVAVCTGDMSQKTYKQYDIETWMPSRAAYGETHSSSNLLDFQARRSNIRYRDAEGKLRYCHTLNNTAVASPRILIPLLENHQQEDGSILIPQALRPYLNGMERITPPSETD
ncbi:serine--tRNA ligase [Paenibacillus glucanolyticus]|jgi:seryl-tRNA synthetase|uniref:serine--tRNA ligase n=1 Tax=Paenibacillus TaxID=44249 RepID=UPI0003E29193|nr:MULTISPECIES: serine--tRNA ligase [Paenibacillus]ANA79975.1 serine--tRNA ligase [Paenibacillus glucanolyticus]AVV55999.1 serine--tRNA ligase [Paenibacillus glucanolyticus]ETT38362.1 seryl-tRNA ligase [Paenibacillus sp. FSL R5-808]